MRCCFLPFCPRFPGRTQRFWCPGDLPGPPTPSPLPAPRTRGNVSAPEVPAGQSAYQGGGKREARDEKTSLQRRCAPPTHLVLVYDQLRPSTERDLRYCISGSSRALGDLRHLPAARSDNTYTWSGDTWSFSSISRGGSSTPGTQSPLSRDGGLPLQSTALQLPSEPADLAGLPHDVCPVLGVQEEGHIETQAGETEPFAPRKPSLPV